MPRNRFQIFTYVPQQRLYALSGESRKVLVIFSTLAVAHTILGIVFIVLARNACEEAFRNEGFPLELTYYPRAAWFLLQTGPRLVCIPDSQTAFNIRVTYSCLSIAYGMDVHPSGLLRS